MNTNTNNEAIAKVEEKIRFTEEMLQNQLAEIKMFGMPRNPSSCLQVNRQLNYLRQTLKEEKAELAELTDSTEL
jgi:hypothetical protein